MLLLLKKKSMPMVFVAVILLISVNASTQSLPPINEPDNNRPLAFAGVSDSITVSTTSLSAIIEKRQGDTITINTGNGTVIEGVLELITSKYNNALKTVSIRIISPEKILFSISRILLPSDKILYRGIITGKNTGDCFELVQNDDQYTFIKKNINKFRAE